jgi:hypothetical protein
MQTSIDVSEQTQVKPSIEPTAKSGSKLKRLWLCPIFAIALAIRVWFAFADGHSAIVFSCDASEYLRDARGLAQLISASDNAQAWTETFRLLGNNLTVQEAAQLRQQFAPVKELAIAGPIFPLTLLLSFAAFGLPVAQIHWQAPVIFQCLLSAITCVLIALIGQAAWNKKVGIAAGTIAALYPGFIVNSIRMYSESFSCFLLCAVVALTIPVVSRSGMFHSISAGICLASLQLTRSVMILVTGLTFAITAWLSPGKSRILRLTGLIAGLAIVFAPWLLFQQLAFGKSSVVVDRVGHYNLFIGTNIATQGYLSYPYPDGRGIEKKSYGTLVAAQIKESPERFARLMLDKPLRLLKFPWNDFRTPIGPIGNGAQVIFHQLMLAFAAVGATLCLFQKGETAGALRLKLLLATLLAMHAVYLAFITVPRYNLTSIPFLALFAGAGLVAVINGLRNGENEPVSGEKSLLSKPASIVLVASLILAFVFARIDWLASIFVQTGASPVVALILTSLMKALPLSAFFVVLFIAASQMQGNHRFVKIIPAALAVALIPLCSLPLRSHGRMNEWSLSSESAHAAKQYIPIPKNKIDAVSRRDCFIIVDSMNWQALGNDGHLIVNGIELKGPVMPLMPFTQTLSNTKSRGQQTRVEQHYLECEDIYSSLTAAAGGGNLDIRQWFAVKVPREVINAAVAQDEPMLNIELDQKPSSGSDLYGVYADAKDRDIRIPSVSRFSWEKAFYGVENEDGFTDSRYDDRIAIGSVPQLRTSSDTTNWIRIPNIRLLIAPPASAPTSANAPTARSEIGRSSNRSNERTEVRLPVFADTPFEKAATYLIAVTAKLSSKDNEAKNIPVSFTAVFESVDDSGKTHRYRSPWVPTSIVAAPGVNHIRFSYPFSPGALPGQLTNVKLQCGSGGVAGGTDYFAVNGSAKTHTRGGELNNGNNLDSLSIELLKLQSNPIGYGYEVL